MYPLPRFEGSLSVLNIVTIDSLSIFPHNISGLMQMSSVPTSLGCCRWDAPVYLTRVWCLFELFTAIRNRRAVKINIMLPPSQREAFRKAMSAGHYGEIEQVLDNVQAENATATSAADLAAIHGLVGELPGGFLSLNETVRDHLRRWFEGQGAVLTASRVQALRRSSNIFESSLRRLSDSSGSISDVQNSGERMSDSQSALVPLPEGVPLQKMSSRAPRRIYEDSETDPAIEDDDCPLLGSQSELNIFFNENENGPQTCDIRPAAQAVHESNM